ncbi:hypothetical protein Scep_015852 [Stephania cephalantha]|uniref:LOB domain-containing protein n=1 Tax=Stephania cephalantha TaxID=152367 RepID=A0AAP0J6C8_9MAGN
MAGLRSSCGACKFLRRKCEDGCVFAPYFSYEQAASHFAAVHKVFGASNVSKLLSHLPPRNRRDAAFTISYEAQARMLDPIYGCVGRIIELQLQVAVLQREIELLETQVSMGVGTESTNVQLHNTSQTMYDIRTSNQFPLQPDCMYTQDNNCHEQLTHEPSFSMDATTNLTTNHDIGMGLPYAPTCTWGDSSLFMDLAIEPNTSQQVNLANVMGVQEEIFPCELQLDDTAFFPNYCHQLY